jgi:hypothetical protein
MATIMRYLRDPYNQVFKFTANQNSELHLKINKHIFYSVSEINDLLEATLSDDYFPAEMDSFSKKVYWLMANMGTEEKFTALTGPGATDANNNVLHYFNSYPHDICWANPAASMLVLNKYFPTTMVSVTFPNHGSTWIKGVCWFDVMERMILYKDKYITAPETDIAADRKWWTEPIRKTSNVAAYTLASLDPALWTEVGLLPSAPWDNITMKLPATSYMVLPVRSTNIPTTDNGGALTKYANAIVTIPTGVTGLIEMPFTLLQITGTGTVSVNGITYTLPTDNAALKAVITARADVDFWYRAFTILTNTGGIEAEFLVSDRIPLFNKNYIDLGLISGDVSVSRIDTATPLLLSKVSVNMKGAEAFSFDFANVFTKNKSFNISRCVLSQWDMRMIHFKKASGAKYLSQFLYNYTGNDEVIDAGTPVTDTCWAAKLTPGDETFDGSLQLTFTTYDGSDCYYTLDGTTPSASKTKYTTPFTITATTTVKWINIKTGYADSHVNTRVITLNAVLTDTFTDTDAVKLNAHTMDKGAGWTADDHWTISSNKLGLSAVSGVQDASVESGHANVDVTLKMTIPNSNTYCGGVIVRYADATHRIIVYIEKDGAAAPYMGIEIDKTLAHVEPITHELITDTLRVVANGNNIKGYWKGNLVIDWDTSTGNTRTKVGVVGYSAAPYSVPIMDDFNVIAL